MDIPKYKKMTQAERCLAGIQMVLSECEATKMGWRTDVRLDGKKLIDHIMFEDGTCLTADEIIKQCSEKSD